MHDPPFGAVSPVEIGSGESMRPSLLPDRVYAEVRGFQWHRDSKYGGDASLQIVRDVGTRESVDGHRSATEPGRATRQAAPASAAARCAATCVSAPPGAATVWSPWSSRAPRSKTRRGG